MASLEDRLRNELRQIGADLDQWSIRPLRPPAPRRAPGLTRWLAPVAAMVAVVGVITGVSLARSPAPRHPVAAITGMPPYYVTVDDVTVHQGAGGKAQEAMATVHAAATGRTLSSVRLPAARNIPTGQLFFWGISAAADDQTFLIQQARQLLVLRVSPDGRSARLSQLRVSLPPTASVALSPDGSTAAIESMSACGTTTFGANYTALGCRNTEIQLISLDSGATTRTWSTEALTAQSTWVSWTRGSQILFLWPGTGAASGPDHALRLLDIRGPGSNLLHAQVLPVQADYQPSSSVPYAFMTPDGSAVIFSPGLSDGSASTIEAVSARTGKLLSVLGQHTEAAAPGCNVLSLAPGGQHALIRCSYPPVALGRLDNGRFTRLTGITNPWGVAAW